MVIVGRPPLGFSGASCLASSLSPEAGISAAPRIGGYRVTLGGRHDENKPPMNVPFLVVNKGQGPLRPPPASSYRRFVSLGGQPSDRQARPAARSSRRLRAACGDCQCDPRETVAGPARACRRPDPCGVRAARGTGLDLSEHAGRGLSTPSFTRRLMPRSCAPKGSSGESRFPISSSASGGTAS